MDVNLWRNQRGGPSDAEIDNDVAELKRLLEGAPGPAEPHPAYWQNFVVHVRARIDEKGGRSRRRSFTPAWASLGAVAIMAVVVVATGVLDKQVTPVMPQKTIARAEAPADLAAAYSSTDTKGIILSGEEVKMINAIVSDKSDDAVFEAMVDSEEL